MPSPPLDLFPFPRPFADTQRSSLPFLGPQAPTTSSESSPPSTENCSNPPPPSPFTVTLTPLSISFLLRLIRKSTISLPSSALAASLVLERARDRVRLSSPFFPSFLPLYRSIALLRAEDRPDVKYSDIVGMDSQKQEIREAVELAITEVSLSSIFLPSRPLPLFSSTLLPLPLLKS